MPHYPPLLMHMGLSTYVFQEYSRRSKTLSQFTIEEVKTLPIDGYRAMLNTEPLGGEGVPLFSIIFVPYLRRAPKSGILRE
jgi:hypothetical protein